MKRVLLVGSAISGIGVTRIPGDTSEQPFVCAPSVPAVKAAVITRICELLLPKDQPEPSDIASILSKLRDFEEASDGNSDGVQYRKLAFEALIELIWETNRASAKSLVDSYRCDTPNFCHYAIAQALLSGELSVVYTTNFDELIEIAVEALSQTKTTSREYLPIEPDDHPAVIWKPPAIGQNVRIIKVHGTISLVKSAEDIGKLVCRHLDMAKPLPQAAIAMLSTDVADAEFHLIGYSGSDTDIRDPLLKICKLVRPDAIFWHDRRAANNPNTPLQPEIRARRRWLQLVDGRPCKLDLKTADENNILLKWAGTQLFASLSNMREMLPSVSKSGQGAALSNSLSELQKCEAEILLGRILESCGSPEARTVLLPLCKQNPKLTNRLGRYIAQGYLHANDWSGYNTYVSDNRKNLDILDLEIDTWAAFALLMEARTSRWLFPKCIQAHIELAKVLEVSLATGVPRKPTSEELFATHTLVHFANRVLRVPGMRVFLSWFAPEIARAISRCGSASQLTESSVRQNPQLTPRLLVRAGARHIKRYLEHGNLNRAIVTRREQINSMTLFSRTKATTYQRILAAYQQVEEEATATGMETHAINIMRDLCRWALVNERGLDALNYLKELEARTEALPGHSGDRDKLRALKMRINQMLGKI